MHVLVVVFSNDAVGLEVVCHARPDDPLRDCLLVDPAEDCDGDCGSELTLWGDHAHAIDGCSVRVHLAEGGLGAIDTVSLNGPQALIPVRVRDKDGIPEVSLLTPPSDVWQEMVNQAVSSVDEPDSEDD